MARPELGSGQFGTVYDATDRETGETGPGRRIPSGATLCSAFVGLYAECTAGGSILEPPCVLHWWFYKHNVQRGGPFWSHPVYCIGGSLSRMHSGGARVCVTLTPRAPRRALRGEEHRQGE
jgi:hypothetical protein